MTAAEILATREADRSVRKKIDLPANIDDVTDQEALVVYHGILECREYATVKLKAASMPKPSGIHNADTADLMAAQLKKIEKVLESHYDQCEGIGLDEIDDALFDASLEAGIRGDLGAQACFVSSVAFGGDQDKEQKYLTHTPDFINHGIDIGYWPTLSVAFVLLMNRSGLRVEGSGFPPLWDELPGPDPYRVYRAMRLAYLRSDSESAAVIAENMDMLDRRYHFLPKMIVDADRWAREEYENRFSGTPPLHGVNLDFCLPSP